MQVNLMANSFLPLVAAVLCGQAMAEGGGGDLTTHQVALEGGPKQATHRSLSTDLEGSLETLGRRMQTSRVPFNMHFDAPGFIILYGWTGFLIFVTLVYRLVMWGACRRDMVRERVSENQREKLIQEGGYSGKVYGTLATTYAATSATVSSEVIDHGGRSGIIRKRVVYQFGYGYTFFGNVLYFFYMLWLVMISFTLLMCLLSISFPAHFLWFSNDLFALDLCPNSVWQNHEELGRDCRMGRTDLGYMKANLGGVFLIFFVISFSMWLLYVKNSNSVFNFFQREMSLREAEYVSIEERIVEVDRNAGTLDAEGNPREVEQSRQVVENAQVMVEDINGITYRYFVFQSTRLTYDHTAKIFAPQRNEVVERNTLNALHLYKQEPLTVDSVSVDILLRGKNKIDVRVPSFFWFCAQELTSAVILWQVFQALTLAFFWQVAAGAVLLVIFLIQLYLAAMARKRVMQNIEQTAKIQGIRLLVYRDERRDKYLEFGKPVDMSRMDLNRRANQRDTRHPTLSKIVEADDEEDSESEGSSMSDGHMLGTHQNKNDGKHFSYMADMQGFSTGSPSKSKIDMDGSLAFAKQRSGQKSSTSTPSTSAPTSRDASDSEDGADFGGLRGIQSLNARSKLRNGTFRSVHSAELVPGDLIEIPEGVVMPCDCVLLEGHALVNEADLTGEPMPVTKYPIERRGRAAHQDRLDVCAHGKKHYLHCGTSVLQSLGAQRSKRNLKALGLVVQTGTATMKGSMIRRILYPSPIYYRFSDQLGPFIFTTVFLLQLAATIPVLVYGAHDGRGFFQIAVMAFFEAISLSTQVASPLMLLGLVQSQQSAADRLKNSPSTTITLSPERMIMAGEISIQCLDKTGTITEEGLQLHGIRPVCPNIKGSGGASSGQPGNLASLASGGGDSGTEADGQQAPRSLSSAASTTTPNLSSTDSGNATTTSSSDRSDKDDEAAIKNRKASQQQRARSPSVGRDGSEKKALSPKLEASFNPQSAKPESKVRFGPLVNVRDTPDQPLDKNNLFEVAMATCHTVTKVDGHLYGNSVEREMVRILNVDFAARIGEGVEYFRPKRHPGGGELLFKTVRQFEFDQATQMQSVIVDMRGENARTRPTRGARGSSSSAISSGHASDGSQYSARSGQSGSTMSGSTSFLAQLTKQFPHSHVLFSKGSFEAISKRCLPETLPVDAEQLTKSLAVEGYYVIAMAYRVVDEQGNRSGLASQMNPNAKTIRWHTSSRVDLEQDMAFLGLIYFLNELKSDSSAAIAEMRHGNVDPVMITGDNLWTGIHVAEKVGMLPKNAVLLGADVQKASPSDGSPRRGPSNSHPEELSWQFLRECDKKHIPVWMNLLTESNCKYSSHISFFGTEVTGPQAAEARRRTGNSAFYNRGQRGRASTTTGAGTAQASGSDSEAEQFTSSLYPTRGGEPTKTISQMTIQEGRVQLSPNPVFMPPQRKVLFDHFNFNGDAVDDRRLLRLIERLEYEVGDRDGPTPLSAYHSLDGRSLVSATLRGESLELAGLSDADDTISEACEDERKRLLDRDMEGGSYPDAMMVPRVSQQYRSSGAAAAAPLQLDIADDQADSGTDDVGGQPHGPVVRGSTLQVTSKRPKYYFALTEGAYRFLADHDPQLLEKIFSRVVVFGRMTPGGKVDVIRRTQSNGHVVGMCGDGGNDCAALRASHAGVALADGDASIVAPFSSSSKSLFAVVETIRQGRCCLRVSTALLEFHVIAGIACAIFKVCILSQKAYPSEFMYLLKDSLIPSLIVTALVAATPPLHFGFKKNGWCNCCRREQWGAKNGRWSMLNPERPTGNLIAKPRLFFILMAGATFGLFSYLMILFVTSVNLNPWFHAIKLYDLRAESELIAPWSSNLLSTVLIACVIIFNFIVYVAVSADGKFRNNVFSQCWVYVLLIGLVAPVMLIYFMCNSPIHALFRTNVDNMSSWQHSAMTTPATRLLAFSNADVKSPNFWFTRPNAALFEGHEDAFAYGVAASKEAPPGVTGAPGIRWTSAAGSMAVANPGVEAAGDAAADQAAAAKPAKMKPANRNAETLLQRQVDHMVAFMKGDMARSLQEWRTHLLKKMDPGTGTSVGAGTSALAETDLAVLFPTVGNTHAAMIEMKTAFITKDANLKQWVHSLYQASQLSFADLRKQRGDATLQPLSEQSMLLDVSTHACQKMCEATWSAKGEGGAGIPDDERFYCWWAAVSDSRCLLMPRTDVAGKRALGPDYLNFVRQEILPHHDNLPLEVIFNTPGTPNIGSEDNLVSNVVVYPLATEKGKVAGPKNTEQFAAFQLNRHNVLSWRSQNWKAEGGYDAWLQEALPSFYPRSDYYMPRNGFTDYHASWNPEVYENYPAPFVPSFSFVFVACLLGVAVVMGLITFLVLKFWQLGYEPPHARNRFQRQAVVDSSNGGENE